MWELYFYSLRNLGEIYFRPSISYLCYIFFIYLEHKRIVEAKSKEFRMTDRIVSIFSVFPFSVPQLFTDYKKDLANSFYKYRTWFEENKPLNDILEFSGIDYQTSKNFIIGLGESILESLEFFPQIEDGYHRMGNFFDNHFDFLYHVTLDLDKRKMRGLLWNCSTNITIPDNKRLFRVREKKLDNYSKLDLFHIPFSKSNKFLNYRYSIPQRPSLYLAETLKCCQQEINIPYQDIVFSVYRFRKDVPPNLNHFIVNFAFDFQLVADNYKSETKTEFYTDLLVISYYLLFWPLIIACNAKKSHPKDPAIEYFIPNILYQYLSNTFKESIIGIRYYSSKLNSKQWVDKHLHGINYAFSTKVDSESDYDERLKNLFDISDPLLLCDVITKKQWTSYKAFDIMQPGALDDLLIF